MTVFVTEPQVNLLVDPQTGLPSHLDESPSFAHVEGGTLNLLAGSLIKDCHCELPRYPSLFPPVPAANLAGGALALNRNELRSSEKVWDQVGLIDKRMVWATPIGIIVACLPRMPLHGLILPKMCRFGRQIVV
jgi:hypothetical protein